MHADEGHFVVNAPLSGQGADLVLGVEQALE